MKKLGELFINISDAILLAASKDILSKVEKYNDKILKYDNAVKFNFNINESDNIFTATAKKVNIGKISNLSTDLVFDINILYFMQDNSLTNINMQLSNISDVDTYETSLYNFYINSVTSLFIAAALVLDNNSISLKNDKSTGINIDQNVTLSVKFDNDDGNGISIFNLFTNTTPVKYTLNTSSDNAVEISKYSSELKGSYEKFIGNENKLIENLQSIDNAVSIDTDLFNKDFVEIEKIDNIKDEYYNMIINSIKRSGTMSLSDFLIILEHGNNFSIKTVEYEVVKQK